MLRWLFLFLLLINVLLLFWFSGFKTTDGYRKETVEQQLHPIRLLSETDQSKLSPKKQSSVAVPPQCWLLSDLDAMEQVEEVERFMRAQGVQTKVITEQVRNSAFVVKVELDNSGQQHQTLAAYMKAERGLDIRPQDLGLDDRYTIGRYLNQAAAEKELQQLVIAGLNAFLIYEEETGNRFRVSVFDQSGQNLSKEIKEIVSKRFSGIKIEKKVCEGVARP